jgi:GntR family transcriptional regulator/MocR family aminotransferase
MPKVSSYISIPGLAVDKKSTIPAYKQVYEGIRTFILNGQLRSGERLPSSRILAEDTGVSRNIILLAYEQLSLEGYITSGVGSGSYVAKNISDTFTFHNREKQFKKPLSKGSAIEFICPLPESYIKSESSKGEVRPFQNSVPAFDHFPYKAWVKCAHKVFRGIEFLHLGYDDARGYYPLREVISGYLRTNRALRCEPEQIVITNGTQQGLNLIASLVIKKNTRFWMEDPGYNNTKAAFMQYGGKPFYVPLLKNGINLTWAMKHCPKPAAVYLTPSHQFPLGGTLPVSKRIQLLTWAHKNKAWLIEDDYDSEFRYIKKPIPSLQGLDNYKRVIYLGSFSKILFPAIRIGYLVLPDEEIAKAFAQAKAFSDRQNSITDQAILYEFMQQGFLYTHLRKMRVLYKKRQDYIIGVFEKYAKGFLKVEKQNSGMHIIGWLHEELDDKKVAATLQATNISAVPLSIYSGKYTVKPALILGYTGFNEKLLKDYALKLVSVLRKCMIEGKIV